MLINVKLLTQAAMVDNLAEKVDDKCPLNYNWDCENWSLYRVAGCLLLRGCLTIKVNGRQLGFSELFVISGVSAVEGCLLSRVPLYLELMHHRSHV